MAPADPNTGWAGITPFLGDVTGSVSTVGTGYRRADFVFMANGGASGSPVYVATSTGGGFNVPQLWWNGAGFGYGGIKAVLG